MATVNVCMIGPTGCGKTSVLAVMLNDVQQFISRLIANGETNFGREDVRPSLVASNPLTQVRLTNAYPCLEQLVVNAKKSGGKVDVEASGMISTGNAASMPLRLSIGRHSTEIVFWDFPGGFFSQTQVDRGAFDADDVKTWEGIITRADVLLIAIDASVQLGEEDLLKDQTYYSRITELVKRSVDHSVTTVVFVPVKCEHLALTSEYDESLDQIVQRFEESRCLDLQARVRQRFGDLMAFAEDPATWTNIDAYFMPMITVGGIKSSGYRFDPVRRRGIVSFAPVLMEYLGKTPFAPRNCDKILALCLLRVYQQLVAEWKADRTILDVIRSWFGDKTPFEAFFGELVRKFQFYPMMARKEIELWKTREDSEKVAAWSAYLESQRGIQYDGCECLNACYYPLSV